MTVPKAIENFFMSSGKDVYCLVKHFEVPPLSSSLHYANAIFEGASIIGKPRKHGYELGFFHPALNYERLHYGMDFFGYEIKHYNIEHLIANAFYICALNGWHERIELEGKDVLIETHYGRFARIYVRPIAYSTNNVIGLGAPMTFDVMHALVPMGAYLEMPKGKGLTVMLYPYPRELAFPHVKASSNYQLSIYARRKLNEYNAKNRTMCSEVVFLNQRGNLTEGTGENILLLRDNEIIAPPVNEGALPGITLRIVSVIAKAMGLKFRFGTFRMSDVENAEALFFTGNAAGIAPIGSIVEVDEHYMAKKTYEVKEGLRSSTMMALIKEYEKIELGDESHGKFFTYLHEWIDDERLQKLALIGEEVRKKRRKACAAITTIPKPPDYWESHKRKMFEELGIKKFL